jgi:hypothetical protein
MIVPIPVMDAAKPAASAAKRPRNSVALAPGSSKEAKRLTAMILDVMAGVRTPQQAADALLMSLPRYYQVEARALQALLEACEPRPKGRQANPLREIAQIKRENERLRQDLGQQQSLVRMAQRAIGLSPPAPPKPAAKTPGKKTRKRKPVVRALSLATRLRQETTEAEAAGVSAAAPPAPTA